jgi:amino acid permease
MRRPRIKPWAPAWRRFPSVYGSRGLVLLCLAVVCFAFGIAYVGPLSVPGVSEGLRPINAIMPLPYWGVLWFRVDQSRALGGVTGMFFAWGYSNAVASVLAYMDGRDNKLWLSAVVYMAIAALILGIAALLNPARSHVELKQVPGPVPEEKEDSDG